MMPRPEPKFIRRKLLEAAQEDNRLKAIERAAATRRTQGKAPLDWHLLEVTERVAALGTAHLVFFNASAARARKFNEDRVERRVRKDIEETVSTLVDHDDNRRRGDFISEDEYTAYMHRLGVARRIEAERVQLESYRLHDQGHTGTGSSTDGLAPGGLGPSASTRDLCGKPSYTDLSDQLDYPGINKLGTLALVPVPTTPARSPREPVLPEYTDSMESQRSAEEP